MRTFRFIGDPKDYDWKIKPIKGELYDFERVKSSYGHIWWRDEIFNELSESDDWQEVIDPKGYGAIPDEKHALTTKKIPNQDQTASLMTKFEMAVFMAMQGMISRSDPNEGWTDGDSIQCIHIAKETFKQLEDEKHI